MTEKITETEQWKDAERSYSILDGFRCVYYLTLAYFFDYDKHRFTVETFQKLLNE